MARRRTKAAIARAVEPRNCFRGPRGQVIRVVRALPRSAYTEVEVLVSGVASPGHEVTNPGDIVPMRTLAIENMIADGTFVPLGKNPTEEVHTHEQ